MAHYGSFSWVLFATTALASPLACAAVDELNEVVVTGTQIKGLSKDEIASPVQVIDRQDIENLAPGGGQPSDFLRNVPQADAVFRSNIQSSYHQIEGNFGGGSVNLRGLGSGATLTLLNGHRQVGFPDAQDGRVDTNSLTPTIAIDRVDLLLDGASAIYGTDAIAGVVNVVTRDRFDGLELKGDVRGETHDWDTSDATIGAIAGTTFSNGVHVMLAGELYNQDGLSRYDRGVIRGIGQAFSSTGFPGNFTVPMRNAGGQLNGASTTRSDPDCGAIAAAGLTQNTGGMGSDTYYSGSKCLYSIKGQLLVLDERRSSARAAASDDVSEHLHLNGSIGYSYITATQHFSQSSSILRPVAVPGTNPGNTFRAVNAAGQPLYAAPDPAHPGAPLHNSAGQVVLSADPTNPASGVPFNEGVSMSFRPLSTTNAPLLGYDNDTSTFRVDGSVSGTINSKLSYNVSVGYSQQHVTENQPDVNLPAFIAALDGHGGPSGNQYYNPFGNALFAQPGSAQYNDPAVVAGFAVTTGDHYNGSQETLDASIDGELLDLPAGALKFATGAQYRRDELQFRYDPLRVAGDLGYNAIPGKNFDGALNSGAAFVEVLVPLYAGSAGKLDLSAAGRYERTGSDSSTNPKVGLVFAAPLFRVRASYSTSFVTPSLFQRDGALGGSVFVFDPRTGQQNVQIYGYTVGSQNLKPETSDNFNAGIQLAPLDSLLFGVDYFNIKFKGLLATPTAQAVVNAGGAGVIRNAQGQITEVDTPYFNASSISVDGLDFRAGYTFPRTPLGLFHWSALCTWMHKYAVRLAAGGPVFDGVGDANNNNIGDPIAEWRANSQLAWQGGDHSAVVSVRYVSQVRQTSGTAVDYARPIVETDLTYSYDFRSVGLKVSAGVLNVFNELANRVTTAGTTIFIPNVQDPFERRVFLTVTKTF